MTTSSAASGEFPTDDTNPTRRPPPSTTTAASDHATADGPSFPTSAGQLTPAVIGKYLAQDGVASDARLVEVRTETIGTGKMGDNVRCHLTWDGDADHAPATIVAKLPATDETARTMAGGAGAYRNEVMFYRVLAPRTSMRTPRIHTTELSDDGTNFLLLMEDLAPAEPGDQTVGEPRERIALALAEAARLAATFLGDDTLEGLDHVTSPTNEGAAEFGQSLLEGAWPGFCDRFADALSDECLALGERYVSAHASWVSGYAGPRTLAHGDFRTENILFTPTAATTVDWQTPSLSSPVTDAAYLIGGSLDIEDRRAWEAGLLATYRSALEAAGVELASDECEALYREFSLHGILITVLGASFSSPAPRSDRMFTAMIRRHLQHAVDCGAHEFLG